MLHELVAGHAQTMFAELRDDGTGRPGLPRYVERELAEYLRCGILAHGTSSAKLRALVPAAPSDAATSPSCAAPTSTSGQRTRRLPWAELLRRVFADDLLRCPCGGRRSVVAIVAVPAIARAVLVGLGLPVEAATFAPARAPPQTELWLDEAS